MFLHLQRRNLLLFFVICGGVLLIIATSNGPEHTNKRFPKLGREQQIIKEAAAENAVRIADVKIVCEKYKLGPYRGYDEEVIVKEPPAPQYSVFYFNRKYGISYCPIYKSGSTSWIYNMCLLMGVSKEELTSGKEQLSTVARRVMPELDYPEADEILKNSQKLMIVRHPFERLLSAYRDKLENSVDGREHGSLHFYKKYGSSIVKKFRDANYSSPRPDQYIRKSGVPGPAGIEPTWREFVDYLIHTDLASYADDHWTPYYLYCTPCLINYDIIAKVETMSRDQTFAIHKLGLDAKLEPVWRHSNTHSNASKIYFSQLSKDMVYKLYKKFEVDFELFGYSPTAYYNYATAL